MKKHRANDYGFSVLSSLSFKKPFFQCLDLLFFQAFKGLPIIFLPLIFLLLLSLALAFSYSLPDLSINSSQITFNVQSPVENQIIVVFSNISNLGQENASNATIQFFNNNIEIGNKSINITNSSSVIVNMSFSAEIGPNNITVIADPENKIAESNESNNNASSIKHVNAYTVFYGKTSSTIALGSSNSLIMNAYGNIQNIFFVDTDSNVNFASLQALGRKSDGTPSRNDFDELDSILNMSNFQDSIANVFSKDGTSPKSTAIFNVKKTYIYNVPIINSTNSSNFITGILWDTSDDTNGEFDLSDKEDIVFITKNENAQGKYGVYDFEIKIPALLRKYRGSQDSVDFYLDVS